jgi:hypothetical protein
MATALHNIIALTVIQRLTVRAGKRPGARIPPFGLNLKSGMTKALERACTMAPSSRSLSPEPTATSKLAKL